MSSKRPSEPPPALDRLEEDLPTTAEDVAALHRLREEHGAAFSLRDVNLLNPPEGLPLPRRLTTSEGWEPFEL